MFNQKRWLALASIAIGIPILKTFVHFRLQYEGQKIAKEMATYGDSHIMSAACDIVAKKIEQKIYKPKDLDELKELIRFEAIALAEEI